jgi:hypothetical protein
VATKKQLEDIKRRSRIATTLEEATLQLRARNRIDFYSGTTPAELLNLRINQIGTGADDAPVDGKATELARLLQLQAEVKTAVDEAKKLPLEITDE